MSRRSHRALLMDIYEAGQTAIATVAGKDAAALRADYVWTLGLVKCLEIVGEAASCLSPEFRALHTDVPWTAIIGMRNRLVHAYYEINYDLIWKTLTEDLPPFVERVKAWLPTEPESAP